MQRCQAHAAPPGAGSTALGHIREALTARLAELEAQREASLSAD